MLIQKAKDFFDNSADIKAKQALEQASKRKVKSTDIGLVVDNFYKKAAQFKSEYQAVLNGLADQIQFLTNERNQLANPASYYSAMRDKALILITGKKSKFSRYLNGYYETDDLYTTRYNNKAYFEAMGNAAMSPDALVAYLVCDVLEDLPINDAQHSAPIRMVHVAKLLPDEFNKGLKRFDDLTNEIESLQNQLIKLSTDTGMVKPSGSSAITLALSGVRIMDDGSIRRNVVVTNPFKL